MCSKDGSSPLLIACLKNHYRTAKKLLEHDANVNQCDERGYSSLMLACKEGNDKIVDFLLKKGADINLCNKNGGSPLCKACEQCHDNIVTMLLSYGADVNLCRKDGLSPLHVACINEQISTVEILLKNDAVNLCDKEGCSVFVYASKIGHESIKQLFKKFGADSNSFSKASCSSLKLKRKNSIVEVLKDDAYGKDVILKYENNRQSSKNVLIQ